MCLAMVILHHVKTISSLLPDCFAKCSFVMRGSKGNVFFNHLSIIILQVLIVFPFSSFSKLMCFSLFPRWKPFHSLLPFSLFSKFYPPKVFFKMLILLKRLEFSWNRQEWCGWGPQKNSHHLSNRVLWLWGSPFHLRGEILILSPWFTFLTTP